MVQEITSSEIISIETHFKVSAGPGSGKTYWLVKHIKNVLQNSDRLVPTTKIACITYTNTGVEEIRKRLSGSLEKVEVSTIHNFLYKYLVKPYLHTINVDSNGNSIVNLRRLDGHDEHLVYQGFVIKWLQASKAGKLAYDNLAVIIQALYKLRWSIGENGEPELVCSDSRFEKALKTFVKNGSLIEYKKLYWETGTIHHDDVLYFSLKLIQEKVDILESLRNMFPYLFIDEFQDTNPLQTQIVKQISSEKTIVGIIGDAAQSIFSFQGATLKEFVGFSLPNQQIITQYTILKNRRSSDEIVTVLNHCRSKHGLVQQSTRGPFGNKPDIIVGEFDKILSYIEDKEYVVLCFRNDNVGKFKFGTSVSQNTIWNSVFSSLSNRARKFHDLVYGIEYIKQGRLTDGLKHIHKINSVKAHKILKQQIAIELIDSFLACYDILKNNTITEICNEFLIPFQKKNGLKPISKISSGEKKKFADGVTYEQLVQGANLRDDSSKARTIHKAKGSQFRSVMVYMENESIFKNHVLEADVTTESDDARLYYVALSRAENHLCVAVPKLSSDHEAAAKEIGFGEVIRL
jgi:DNA helicase-2/ATP-dependent DNA helicase PcrA